MKIENLDLLNSSKRTIISIVTTITLVNSTVILQTTKEFLEAKRLWIQIVITLLRKRKACFLLTSRSKSQTTMKKINTMRLLLKISSSIAINTLFMMKYLILSQLKGHENWRDKISKLLLIIFFFNNISFDVVFPELYVNL